MKQLSNRYWMYAPGEHARFWDEFYSKSIIGVGWNNLKFDLSNLKTFDEVHETSQKYESKTVSNIDSKQLYNFLISMHPGDKVFVKDGRKKIVGYGVIKSDYYFDSERREYKHLRQAEWITKGSWVLPDSETRLPMKTLTELKDSSRIQFYENLINVNNKEIMFGEEAFSLMQQLRENPNVSYYTANKAIYLEKIEEPFHSLMRKISSKFPESILKEMETEKNLFSRIPKNDYGKGGIYDYYWGAFYPKESKRTDSLQLYVMITPDVFRFGFDIGVYDKIYKNRLKNNCSKYSNFINSSLLPILQSIDCILGLRDNDDSSDSRLLIDNKVEWSEWLKNPETFGYSAVVEIIKNDMIKKSEKEIVEMVSNTFKKMYSLVLLAQHDEPVDHLAAYLGLNSPAPKVTNPIFSIADIEKETYFSEIEIVRWLSAIKRKKQAIFYGPPGTGKTFIAKSIAKYLIGGGDGAMEILQFHPSYAYEDFMQGLRPMAVTSGGLEYAMVPGRFKEFCKNASKVKGTCVLILDEINRANLSRVFGELMYLLEYRDMDIPLLAGERFSIPDNVLIIGTMNTADRSIALVDHALRRRFAFLQLKPQYEILRKYHTADGFNTDGLIATLDIINKEINNPHFSIGISYFLDKDIFSNIQDIWQMEIEPYLEEHFFDQPDKAASFSWERVASKILEK